MAVPARLRELVERFEREHAAYRSGEYNEAQARVEFIKRCSMSCSAGI